MDRISSACFLSTVIEQGKLVDNARILPVFLESGFLKFHWETCL